MRITALPDTSSEISTPINQPSRNEPPALAASAVPDVSRETLPLKEVPQDDGHASRFAELARKEKIYRSKVQAREEALRQREEAIKAKEQEYNTNYVPKTKIGEMFQQDPYRTIGEWGMTPDQVAQALLTPGGPQDSQIRQLKEEIAALKAATEKTTQSIAEEKDSQFNQAVAQIRNDVKALVAAGTDFRTIKDTGQEDEVVDLVVNVFKNGWEEKGIQPGTVLSNDEAAHFVENKLKEEIFSLYNKDSIKEYLLSRTSAETKPLEASPQSQQTKQSQQITSKTLAHTQTAPSSKRMTPTERAIALLEGRLTN